MLNEKKKEKNKTTICDVIAKLGLDGCKNSIF
jgi:hypothetical protein